LVQHRTEWGGGQLQPAGTGWWLRGAQSATSTPQSIQGVSSLLVSRSTAALPHGRALPSVRYSMHHCTQMQSYLQGKGHVETCSDQRVLFCVRTYETRRLHSTYTTTAIYKGLLLLLHSRGYCYCYTQGATATAIYKGLLLLLHTRCDIYATKATLRFACLSCRCRAQPAVVYCQGHGAYPGDFVHSRARQACRHLGG
jgi:hypothetical protein